MKTIIGFVIVGLAAGLVPFGIIALARSQPSPLPPIHPIQDMYKQQKFRPQYGNRMFADGRAMRPLVPDASSRNALELNPEVMNEADGTHMLDGNMNPIELGDEETFRRVTEGTEMVDGKPAYVKRIPVNVTMDLLKRGRERFTINCAVCHGQAGYGDGTVAMRAAEIQAANGDATGWVAPKDFHTDDMREQPVGKIFNTITNGARTMPAYAKQVTVLDRWAIVAYVKALQRSQDAKIGDMPAAEREKYK